ncbi:ROK family protein [Amycolatopsis sp. NPDC059027]|uniref:ROK family protein n=1 Tax=unclassified Amycolatopsis TaxID=2618356 RepID=UPI00366F1470
MTQPVRHDSMRARNLGVVLDAVQRGGPQTRAALAERTGLTKSTVSKMVGDLIEAGILAESGPARAGERGRPGVEVVLSGDRVAALGCEINVDYIAVCLLDLAQRVRFTRRRGQDNRGKPAMRVIAQLRTLAIEAMAEARRLGLDVAGAGLAMSGPVAGGVLLNAPNLGWHDVHAVEMLRLPVETVLGNEANLAALGELWFGAGERDFLYVSGEIGIGAGLVVGGELFHGARGLAGELGHVVVSPGGPRCRCGGAGCLETAAGQEAILTAAGDVETVAELLTRLERGEDLAVKACGEAARALGIALTSTVNLLDFDRVVLGGIYAPLFDWLAPPIERILADRLVKLRTTPPTLIPSQLGGQAATLGAAGLIVHQVLATPTRFLSRTR